MGTGHPFTHSSKEDLMATTSESSGTMGARAGSRMRARALSIGETKAATKTTEFYAMVGVIAAILIAAWWVGRNGAPDAFRADRAWLYVSIVASAYMVSRGLAKSGSHDIHEDGADDR
jgi:hypothetical protein